MKATLRFSLATLFGSLSLFVASTALADGEACYNDDDCPGTACGDAVCNWSKTAAAPDGMKIFACNPAGSQPKASDGWCTTTDDCKCKGLGATCVAPYCTFTKPTDAPAGSGGTGAGGTGAAIAGATSTAGMSAAGSAAKPAEESSGCSMSVPGGTNTGVALALGMLGLGAAFARRRR